MTSKQIKRTVTTTNYSAADGAGSSVGSTTSSSRRSGRAISPTRISRIQEQEELQGLNDRLAAYIDKVRSLEAENNRLTQQIKTTEEYVRREVSSVKHLYESELSELRRLLDETAKEKARLQIEANKYRIEFEDLLEKYNKRDREASGLERRVQILERQLAETHAREWEKENQKLKADLARLDNLLADSKKHLEGETLLRVDLENRVKTLKEDLHFKSQVYEQELEESRIRTTTQLQDVDGRIEQEYEARLQDALREIRAQHDYDMQSVKVELESMYESKIEDLRGQAARSNSSSSAAWDELTRSQKSMDDLQSELNKLRSEHAGYEARIHDLERQLARERDDFRNRLQQRDHEITNLRIQVEDLEIEYANLLEIKIKLDREIEAYRKLLESEESRMAATVMNKDYPHITLDTSVGAQIPSQNIQSWHSSTPQSQFCVDSGKTRSTCSRVSLSAPQLQAADSPRPIAMLSLPASPASDRPASASSSGIKRRRRADLGQDVEEFNQKSSSSGFSRSSTSSCGVAISEVDVDGKFIKLTNTTDKDIPLNQWQIRHVAEENETRHKFVKNIIKAGQSLTIWSADGEQTHNPPHDLVMKGKRWFVSSRMTTTLLDQDEAEVASCIMTKNIRTVSSYSQRRSGLRDGLDSGELQDKDKCHVM